MIVTGCLLAASSYTSVTRAQSPPQKPHLFEPFATEDRGSLPTLAGMWRVADVVVEGIVDSERATDYSQPLPQITTTYTLTLIEVFKSSAAVTADSRTIDVRRRGGTREEPARIVTVAPATYPLFQRGERYILFLTRHEWVPPAPHQGVYYSEATRTADSAFKVRDGVLDNTGTGPVARALQGTDAAHLRAELRKLRAPG